MIIFVRKLKKIVFRLILMVSTTYIFFIKDGALSEESHFLIFFSLHNSQKNAI